MVADTRDVQGRFTKGNPGGPGNPYAKRVAELRSRLLGAITDEQWDTIARQLIEDAQHVDPEIRLVARRELLDRAAGRAVQPVAVSNDDQQSLADVPEGELEKRLETVLNEMGYAKRNGG